VKAVVQRVSEARVRVRGETAGEVGPGLCVLLGLARGDTPANAQRLAEKVARLRIFEDEDGRFDRSLLDVGGEALVVSQFTLYADTRKGRRPSFLGAAEPTRAAELVEHLARALETHGVRVGRGVFGAEMAIDLLNDGPFTIVFDTASP